MTALENRPVTVPRVLLVDDRADNLMALEAALEPLGFDLQTASSGREALHHLLEFEVDAIVLDVQMPEMDGFETAELIKSRVRDRNVPIVFLTAIYNEVSHQLRGFELGATDYLCKPVEPAVLRAKLALSIDGSSRLRRLERSNEEYAEALTVLRDRLSRLDGARAARSAVALERVVDAEFDLDPDGPGRIRQLVRDALGESQPEVSDRLCLVLSELVTNAIVHTTTAGRVAVDIGRTLVRVEVTDGSTSPPRVRRRTSVTAAGGRGLLLVERLCDRTGWTRTSDGKVVWLEIDLPVRDR